MRLSLQNRVLSHSVISELSLLAGVLAATFTYLDVPLWNSLLFSVAVISQAAFGTVVLTRILQGVPSSLLLLLGPGLMLGGALSFALFQIVARGVIGLIVVIIVGFTSVAHLIRSPNWQPLGSERLWVLGQIVGLAALALTWEFPELLPVAIAFFALGFITGDMFTTPRWVKQVAVVIAAAVIITPLFFRQDYWWIVTDDYLFFEMLSRHITHSGPFADWGAANFGRYHWLSYGWNGLLNELGGTPETFTTLTRVTPLIYSVALAGSLVFMAKYFVQTGAQMLAVIPAWAILAINRLDWSGTSTAGVYAVTTAATAAILLALGTRQNFVRRSFLYTLFGTMVVTTKLPSIFAAAIIIFCAEMFMLTKRSAARPRILVLLLSGAVASLGVIPLIGLASKVVGNFTIAEINPGLGQIAIYGPRFAYLLLALQRLWLIVPVLVVLLLSLRKKIDVGSPIYPFLLGLIPIALLGVRMDTVVNGNFNGFEYFSGPMYFVASLAFWGIFSVANGHLLTVRKVRTCTILVICFVTFGYLWVRLTLAEDIWRRVGTQIFEWDGLKVILLQYVTLDHRVGAAAAAVAVLLFTAKSRLVQPQLVVLSLLTSVSILTMHIYWATSLTELQRERQSAEVNGSIGAPKSRTVGVWLGEKTKTTDVIATNHLVVPGTSSPLADFSLAAWSEREFLVLGPRFLRGESTRIKKGIQASLSFGSLPSPIGAKRLREFGVTWFVVDRLNSAFTDWETAWDVEYVNDRFLVVKL